MDELPGGWVGGLSGSVIPWSFSGSSQQEVVSTIIWVDDRPEGNAHLIQDARLKGVETILLPSTAAAKLWITAHIGTPSF